MYKDTSRISDLSMNLDFRNSTLKQDNKYNRIETEEFDNAKSPQNAFNATGILRYSNVYNNTTFMHDKPNPQQMLANKTIITPNRKSRIEAKMKKLSQNDDVDQIKDDEFEVTNQESITMYDARQSNTFDQD